MSTEQQVPSRFASGLQESRANFVLMVPLALTQLASTAIGITTILIMSWGGADQVAAGTLVVHFYTFFSVFVGGLLTAASPLMAHAFGADAAERARSIAGQGLKLSLAIAFMGTLITWFTADLLILLGQPESLVSATEDFARANALSFIPAMLLLMLRNYASAAGFPRLGLMTIVTGILVNAVLGYGLMFGRWGLPEWGLLGLGVTAAVVNLLMCLMIFVMVQSMPELRLGWRHLAGMTVVKPILRIGTPIGMSGLGSVGTFVVVTFFVASFGPAQVAGHAIALQAANIGFALLWGGAQATTIRMGWATGARNQTATEVAAWTGMVNGILMALFLSVIFLLARDWIAGLFLDPADPANLSAISLATTIMVVVAVYQLVNAPQLVSTSALRGLRDTTIPFLISLSGYWLLGSMFAGILGFGLDYQAVGIWAGLACAVCISGALLVLRLTRLLPRAMALTEDES